MSGASRRGLSGYHSDELGEQLGDDLPPAVRSRVMALTGHMKRREDVIRADFDQSINGVHSRITEVQDTLNARLTEGFNNLEVTLHRLEGRLPPPRGAGAQHQVPNFVRRAQSHDDARYYEDDEDMSDGRGGYPRPLRRDFFDCQAAVHGGHRGGGVEREDDGIGRIKITIPEFKGRADAEAYLEWEMRVNQIFDNHNYSEEKKVRVASIEFTEYAIIWWDQLNRAGERPHTWEAMKRVMRDRFVPAYYTRTLHTKLQRLNQDSKSVDEYYQEMQVLMIRTGIRESEEATMTRFFEGLNDDVRNRVDLMQYDTVQELLHQAERAEQWVKDNHPKVARTHTSTGRRPNQQEGEGGISSKSVASTKSVGIPFKEASKVTSSAGKEASKSDSSTFSTARTSQIECFKCKGRGHMMRDCPNIRKVLLTHEGYVTEGESDKSEHDNEKFNDSPREVEYCDPEVGLTLMTHKVDGDNKLIVEKGQRRGVFQTQCMIKGKRCKLIIDGGSYNNVISKDVVDALSLTTWRHPNPYYMQWLHNVGKLKVTHKVHVPFSIDGYEDKVECDVVTMHMCHIMLGRPWQFDRNVTHQGRANRFTFMH